jgi:hypothetical protein
MSSLEPPQPRDVEIRWQALESAGWQKPLPEAPPHPGYWPTVLALGTTSLLWGAVTSAIISGVGLALIAISLVGWIGDIRGDQRNARKHDGG